MKKFIPIIAAAVGVVIFVLIVVLGKPKAQLVQPAEPASTVEETC